MGKKPIDRTKFDIALAAVPEGIPLVFAFQSACGQAGGKIENKNEGMSCTLPSGHRIKGPGNEGPG